MNPAIRVLRVIARLNIGGPARHVTLLDGGLRHLGYDTLLAYGDPEPGEGSLEYLARDSELRVARIPGLGREIRALSDIRAFLALLRLVFRLRPDIVHTHTAKAGTLGRFAAITYNLMRRREHACLTVHTYHGHVFEGYFGKVGGALIRGIERGLSRFTDRIVTISERQRFDIVTRYRIAPARKTVVIPLGLDLGPFLALNPSSEAAQARASLDLAPDAVVFGFVGRFVPIKDLPTLLHATRIAVERCPSIQLLLVGDGPQRAETVALARQLALEATLRWAGWQHDLRRIYTAMDVCVLSSRNEGTPVAVIEAMASGKPVVATDVGGVADVLQAEVTGLLVRPGRPSELADAMIRLAQSPELRRALGEQGRRRAAERFGTARLVHEMSTLYQTSLAEKRGSLPRAASSLVE